jgi:hypothetical protein
MNMLPKAEAMLGQRADWRPRRFEDWRLAARCVALLWGFYVVTVVARAFLSSDPVTVLQNKIWLITVGTLLTGIIYLAIGWLAPGANLRRKAVVAAVGSLLASLAMAGVLLAAEGQMRKSQEEFRFKAQEGFEVVMKGQQVRIERSSADPLVLTMPKLNDLKQYDQFRIAADTAVVWLFFFAAWSAVYLASVSQRQALGLQRRAAQAETAAQAAQVRALRYQVNPHFLFNTLNSLSSLVMGGRSQEAESMILKLSTFFRTSLSLDPTADVTLDEEIELQRLYLDIEKVRFPRRLKVEIDVPDELRGTRLPALILQPVVENAIKYGVSATKDRVTLRIAARRVAPDRLQLQVSNFGGTTPKSPRGRQFAESTGVGLVNVCQRLEARFGRDASCSWGPRPDGGYDVLLTVPVIDKDG